MRRRLGLLGMLLAVLGLVLGLVFSVGSPRRPLPTAARGTGGRQAVLTALTTTTAAQDYAFDYATTFQTGTSDPGSVQMFSGHGVVSLHPFAMVTTNSAASSFAQVTLVIDANEAWEFGGGDYGTGDGSAPGSPLSGYAGSVEGSLGQELGALTMFSLANPAGRLMLDSSMVGSVQPSSSGSVDGTPVTTYRVSVDLSAIDSQPGLSDQEKTTMSQALAIVRASRYQGTNELVSVDGAGYIREVRFVASFDDGAKETSDSVISDIGCAGTVEPGNPVPVPAPSGCVGPDQPQTATQPPTAGAPAPPAPAACTAAQLQVTVAFNQTGTELGAISLSNTSPTPCSLSGQPRVNASDAAGHALTSNESVYARAGLPPPPSSPVVLAANGTSPQAIVELDWVSCVVPQGPITMTLQFSGWGTPLTIPSSTISPNGFVPEEAGCDGALFAVDVVRALTPTGGIAPG